MKPLTDNHQAHAHIRQTANPELELAAAYVNGTGCNIFLTGKAGTGKTTFLHRLKENCPKRLAVAAPTGVAAINAGGVTLHSLFQLPFGPFVPGGGTARPSYRFSRDKTDLIRNLDLLVIDEISMVRADLLDAVDSALRHCRRSDRPFGDVQLLMIGDLFQLPPVVRREDWQLLREHYATPYFFGSTALARTGMVTIELDHIYRQSDQRFIGLLNAVRNGCVDRPVLDAFNARHRPDTAPSAKDGGITLCTHNRSADAINHSRLQRLKNRSHTFAAEIEGDFPDQAFPTAANLTLKRGAQVMFVRNDPSPEKHYFNGKIGTINRIAGGGIQIRCPEDDDTIVVEPTTWENIEYTLDRETQEIRENLIGTFRQYPLRLAWAVTIHKSQGLTFDRVIIDAQAAFAPGQVYVALSRCRTLEGLSLSTPLSQAAIRTDAAVRRFSETARRNHPTRRQLAAAKIAYQQHLMLDCFDFSRLRARLRRLIALILGNQGVLRLSGGIDVGVVQAAIDGEICGVADSFRRQLQRLFPDARPPAEDAVILARLAKASAYFAERLTAGPIRQITGLAVETDNRTVMKTIAAAGRALAAEIATKRAAVGCCADGFSPARYFRAASGAGIEEENRTAKTPPVVYAEADITHRAFFDMLKTWRRETAEAEGRAEYQVLHQNVLVQIAVHLPGSIAALKRIRGIGKQLAGRYGEPLVAMVNAYRENTPADDASLPDA